MIIGFDAKRVFYNHTGLGWYARNLIMALSNLFPQNKYLLFAISKGKKFKYSFSNNNVDTIMPSKFIDNLLPFYWRTYSIKRDINKKSLDIFHGLSAEIPLSLSKRIKKVVTIHDLIFLRFPNLYPFIDRNIYKLKAKYAAKHSDMIICISEQTKEDLIRFMRVDPDKIYVVYQSCNDIFKTKIEEFYKQQIKEKYKLPNKFILSVGTIEERKNQLNIIKAISNLDEVNLVCVGKFDKNYKSKIIDYIDRNNISNMVYFLENVFIDELAAIYQIATCSLYISKFEGFGIPIIESLFSATPVITSKGSCFYEVAGPYSIYVDYDDISSIKKAITELYYDKQKRDEIINKSQNHLKKFDTTNMANQVMNLYEKLI